MRILLTGARAPATLELARLDVDGVAWRVSLTRPATRNCYVVSATGQYVEYARDEIRRLPLAMHRVASHTALWPLSPLLRRLDPILVPDAFPVSSVLHRERPHAEWTRAIDAARQRYPGVPVVVRSLDGITSRATLDAMRRVGMQLVPSRLVFHQDPRRDGFWRIRSVRHDVARATESPLETRALRTADCERIAELYWLLYAHKHSTLNPRFSQEWLAHGMKHGVLHGEGILHDGRLAAVYLAYCVKDVMTNPVFGYATALPQQLGLYRRLRLLTMQSVRARGQRIHASSGAPRFKFSCGGISTVEYHAVDLRGVRGIQGAAWLLLLRVSRTVAPSLLRRAH